MPEDIHESSEMSTAGLLATAAHTERDLAQGVTRWLLGNFSHELNDAVRSTVFTPPLLCAIACREAGMYWLPLTPHRSATEILGLCVYDASGDVSGAPRSAFPTNTAEFRLVYGNTFTSMLIDEANKARAARGLRPASIVYKGYGIFQYDLQFVRPDENFFKSKQWYSFSECVTRAIRELKGKYERTGDIQQAVRAYNGSGPRAEQYARDVMRLLPFCEEAAADQTPAAAVSLANAREDDEFIEFVPTAVLIPSDDDPAAPANKSEISETTDFATARVLANLGTQEGLEPSPPGAPQAIPAGGPLLAFDFGRAQQFLDACRNSHPRVTYGLGAKVPFHGAVPGRDFTKVDCSGFVREAIRLATNPSVPFPDGSVVQHDWIRARGFEKSSITAGSSTDGAVRIAFLRPQDAPRHIGHVALIHLGKTLESHGGVGPDSRTWDGKSWQAKTYVYVLAAAAQVPKMFEAAGIAVSQAQAAAFTVHHGRRYRATVTLSGFEVFASNERIASMFQSYGFTQVLVAGAGVTRQAEALWLGPDTTAPLDPHLSNIVELPATAHASLSVEPTAQLSSPSPTLISQGVARTNVFSESMPTYHDGLLIIKMRQEPLGGLAPLSIEAMSAINPPDLTTGLSALAFYERAGMIKRVIPLRGEAQPVAAGVGVSALSALVSATKLADKADSGVSFIELERGHNVEQLQTALANDPHITTAARVPVRYLAARPKTRKATEEEGPDGPSAGIAAVPPYAQIMWNLAKIYWQDARNQSGFREADKIRVAVLDTGVDQTHPELKDQIDEYHWQQSADVLRPVSDKDIIGHGTHVCGTIAAMISGSMGIKGICKCLLHVWKIFDDEPTYAPGAGAFVYFVNPIMYRRALAACVQTPVDVMNLSIGGRGAPDPIESALFEQVIASGTIICAAMGNERQQGSPTSYPAAIPDVIAVGATGLDDSVTLFSNSGNHIALSAPGKAIWSTLPTYGGQTGFAAIIGPDGQARQGKPVRRETDYDAWDGTSMATPHVTGCAALLLANKNGGQRLTPKQTKRLLMQSADKVAGMNGASFSPDFGAGRLNLMRLLQENLME